MKVQLRFFAVLREIMGLEELEMDLAEGTTIAGLLETVVSEHPKLGPYIKVLQVAVNHEIVGPEHLVKPEDEIAFLPPVSGG